MSLTEEQRDQLLAEIEELKLNRLAARRDAASGHPGRSVQGLRAAAAITDLIDKRHRLLDPEDES